MAEASAGKADEEARVVAEEEADLRRAPRGWGRGAGSPPLP